MTTEIKLKNWTTFHGRNGRGKCKGFTLDQSTYDNSVDIWPITSKGNDANCRIEISVYDIPLFVEALSQEATFPDRKFVQRLRPGEEDPDFPLIDWKYYVGKGNTRRGYMEWVESQREQREDNVARMERRGE